MEMKDVDVSDLVFVTRRLYYGTGIHIYLC